MFHMAAQMVRPAQREKKIPCEFGRTALQLLGRACGSIKTCSAGSDNETSADTEKQVSVNGS